MNHYFSSLGHLFLTGKHIGQTDLIHFDGPSGKNQPIPMEHKLVVSKLIALNQQLRLSLVVFSKGVL